MSKRSDQKPSVLAGVKQILTCDSEKTANTLLETGDWILLKVTSKRGNLFYSVGRISDFEESKGEG